MYRIEIGTVVRDRLLKAPGSLKIPAVGFDIFVVRDFLSKAQCDGLVRLIDADRQPSALLADDPDPEFRTSESCNLSPAHTLVQTVENKICMLLGIQPSFGETVQGQRYAVGQQFKPHHDFFYTDQPYWPEQERTGGQRTWTGMIFLNEPEEGGQTIFPEAGVRVTPRTGNLLAWNNLDAYGEPNLRSLHQGSPVLGGVKYVITKWFRERPWTYSSSPY